MLCSAGNASNVVLFTLPVPPLDAQKLPFKAFLISWVCTRAQAILAALSACPKDGDVQRWGCQALVLLFVDPVVAAPFRQAGVTAVMRAFAVLQDVETALKSMGVVGAPGMVAGAGGGVGGSGRPKANTTREKWARAMKKVPFTDFHCTGMRVPESRPHNIANRCVECVGLGVLYKAFLCSASASVSGDL